MKAMRRRGEGGRAGAMSKAGLVLGRRGKALGQRARARRARGVAPCLPAHNEHQKNKPKKARAANLLGVSPKSPGKTIRNPREPRKIVPQPRPAHPPEHTGDFVGYALQTPDHHPIDSFGVFFFSNRGGHFLLTF